MMEIEVLTSERGRAWYHRITVALYSVMLLAPAAALAYSWLSS